MKYLIETALLTHGLRSLTNNYLLENWTLPEALIAWIYKGEIKIGTITKYLSFRTEAQSAIRIDCSILENALKNGVSGALTASGTMAVCKKLGIPAAVTCGMGGIGEIKGEELCPDLPALAEIPIILISTGPKDMLESHSILAHLPRCPGHRSEPWLLYRIFVSRRACKTPGSAQICRLPDKGRNAGGGALPPASDY